MTLIPRRTAQWQLIQQSHSHWGRAERTLQDRARDLDRDVTPEELARLLKPWT